MNLQQIAQLGRLAAMEKQAQTPTSSLANVSGWDAQLVDDYTEERPTMSDERWSQMGAYEPPPGHRRHGWTPNTRPGRAGWWVPGGGADSMHIQGVTHVGKDNLTQDTVGSTPYKGGKPLAQPGYPHGQTNWSQGVPGFPRKRSVPTAAQNNRGWLKGLFGGKPPSNIDTFGATEQ